MRNLVDLNSNPLIPNGCRSCHVMERRDGGGTWTMERQHAGDPGVPGEGIQRLGLRFRLPAVVALPVADARRTYDSLTFRCK
jgi:hypothetical protein